MICIDLQLAILQLGYRTARAWRKPWNSWYNPHFCPVTINGFVILGLKGRATFPAIFRRNHCIRTHPEMIIYIYIYILIIYTCSIYMYQSGWLWLRKTWVRRWMLWVVPRLRATAKRWCDPSGFGKWLGSTWSLVGPFVARVICVCPWSYIVSTSTFTCYVYDCGHHSTINRKTFCGIMRSLRTHSMKGDDLQASWLRHEYRHFAQNPLLAAAAPLVEIRWAHWG